MYCIWHECLLFVVCKAWYLEMHIFLPTVKINSASSLWVLWLWIPEYILPLKSLFYLTWGGIWKAGLLLVIKYFHYKGFIMKDLRPEWLSKMCFSCTCFETEQIKWQVILQITFSQPVKTRTKVHSVCRTYGFFPSVIFMFLSHFSISCWKCDPAHYYLCPKYQWSRRWSPSLTAGLHCSTLNLWGLNEKWKLWYFHWGEWWRAVWDVVALFQSVKYVGRIVCSINLG